MQNDLLNVLIVDDEQIIHDELHLFPWEAHGFSVCGEAFNGREALSICEYVRPDICLVDISMPVLNGIEFIRRACSLSPLTQFIILSCHTEFEYAQQALRLGAVDYILKVCISDEELLSALNKAASAQSQKRERIRHRKIQVELERNYEIRAFLSEDVSDLDISEYCIFPCRTVLLIGIGNPSSTLVHVDDMHTSLFSEEGGWFDAEEMIAVRTVDPGLSFEEVKDRLSHLIELNSEFGQFIGYIGDPISNVDELKEIIDSVNTIRDTFFYCHKKKVFSSLDLLVFDSDAAFEEGLSQLLSASTHSYAAVKGFLSSEFRVQTSKIRLAPTRIKSLFIRNIIQFRRLLPVGGVESLTTAILEAESIECLISSICRVLDPKDDGTAHYHPVVRAAMLLIEDHYSEPISLTIVGESVGISSTYLSRLFHADVGVSFNEYVTGVRMEKAMQLLKDSNMKMCEVAKTVGIPNYHYFTTLFKKHAGLTPKAYRKG
jgi:two-component system, response regulator YesN